MKLIGSLTKWFDKTATYGSGIKARPSQGAAGELSPTSSRRNREVFERLTEPEGTAHKTSNTQRETFSLLNSETAQVRADLMPYAPQTQKLESFSLERGTLQSRSTDIAPPLLPPAEIEFPRLSKNVPHTSDNALESLYHDLEVEARRSSQLAGEEAAS